jgi:hypothetical protein
VIRRKVLVAVVPVPRHKEVGQCHSPPHRHGRMELYTTTADVTSMVHVLFDGQVLPLQPSSAMSLSMAGPSSELKLLRVIRIRSHTVYFCA